jgi:DNA-directed RNA polymerase specialized sigma24 family protein
MTDTETVSLWLAQLKQGNDQCAQELWSRYFHRQAALARKLLAGVPRLAEDGEDVALSAFKSFWVGAVDGRFPQLDNRDDLWRLLATITARKAYNVARRGRMRDGKEQVAHDVAPKNLEMGPELNVMVRDQLERLFEMLNDDILRVIAYCKLEGLTNEQIARSIDKSVATVERKLAVIRRIWASERAD